MRKIREQEGKFIIFSVIKVLLYDFKFIRSTIICFTPNVYARFKVETQLLSWLQKYDTEMTDKQNELDELTEKYEEEKQKSEELEVIFFGSYSFKTKSTFLILKMWRYVRMIDSCM